MTIQEPVSKGIYIQEIHLPGFYLFMNCVNHKAEQTLAFGPFETPSLAREYHAQEKMKDREMIDDGDRTLRLSFRDGPLRWMNPLSDSELHEENGMFGHGIVHARPEMRIGLFVDTCY